MNPAAVGPASGMGVGSRRWWALGLLTGANLLVFASVTIMNLALPDARGELDLSATTSGWVVSLYSLSFGALMVLAGRVADVLGLRRCLVGGLVGFAGASVFAGLAPSAEVLLVGRLLQGAAGAFVAATAISLMSVTFPRGRDRERAFAVLGIVMGLGTAGSLLLGGALVDQLSWRWCLLVNVPLALGLAGGILLTAPTGPRPMQARVDLRGAVLVCGSLGALLVGLDRATVLGWTHPGTITLLLAGTAGLAAFALTLSHTRQPLVPPRLLTDRRRVAAFVAPLFVGVAMFAGIFVLTTFLLDSMGLDPMVTGLAFLPFGLAAVASTWLLPRIRARTAPAIVLALGLVLAAAALATLTRLEPDSGYLTGVLPAMLLLGAAGTVVMVTAGDVATTDAGEDSGAAGSLVNAAQQIGAALGTALLTSVVTLTARHELQNGADPVTAGVAGYSRAGLVGGVLLLLAAVAVSAIRDQPRRRVGDPDRYRDIPGTGAADHEEGRSP